MKMTPRAQNPGPTRAVAAGWAAILAPILATLLGACGPSGPPTPAARPPAASAVVAAITEEGLRARLEALGAVSGPAVGRRAVGSAGYEAAADLVEGELRAAGWTVVEDAYEDTMFEDLGGSTLVVGDRTFVSVDVRPLVFAPAGAVEGPVVAVDLETSQLEQAGKGCAVTHYGDLPDHAIVVVRSGDCLRRNQVIAAQQAGAAGFVAVYPLAPGGVAYRPTLLDPEFMNIPAAGVSLDAADALAAAAAAGGTARLVTSARTRTVATRSILAELPGSDPGRVVMLGAHLDSVLDGPGINDDGSGVAALVEIARALAGTRPRATIRLAFWSGEELGLHGSQGYSRSLTDEQRRAIVAYLNLDMIASPNGYAGVYDEPGAPLGSNAVRDLLVAAVERAGGTPVGVDLGGGSDHRSFAGAMIATGGVFSGASEPLTREQASASGSTVAEPADACYHQACDDLANANIPLARVLAAAIADLAVRLANAPGLLDR